MLSLKKIREKNQVNSTGNIDVKSLLLKLEVFGQNEFMDGYYPACVLYVCVVPIAWALHVGILSSARCPNGVGGDNRYWQYRVPARHPVLETQQSDP